MNTILTQFTCKTRIKQVHSFILTHKSNVFFKFAYTVKPAHAVTSIKQSPVLKGYLFLVLS